jgi:diacylglycerol O-acyltransferase / wax synthase
MSPTDSMFLLGESHEHPMHVGGLCLFEPPEGTQASDFMALFDASRDRGEVAPLLRKRARRSRTSLGQWGWDRDTEVDLDYHITHSAVPAPGGMSELLELVSRLHAWPLDRSRPLWEMHLIEGLADGGFAVYTKIHHALTDGVSAMRLLCGVLSEDAATRDMPAPWEAIGRDRAAPSHSGPARSGFNMSHVPAAALRLTGGAVAEIAGLVPALAGALDRALHDRGGSISLTAPGSILNVPIGAARRFAAQSWPLERLRLVAKFADATINDVVLAMCSGALRTFLGVLNALPDDPLIAMVPVSLRGEQKDNQAGNEIGMLMCNLGTHLDDPEQRLTTVRDFMIEGKTSMRTLSRTQIMATSALGAAPLALRMLGIGGPLRPANVMVSSVAGPTAPLHWNGARLTALYPLSIPVDGQALNITCTSTSDQIGFGLTACRRSLPSLQPMLDHLDSELEALEQAVGL